MNIWHSPWHSTDLRQQPAYWLHFPNSLHVGTMVLVVAVAAVAGNRSMLERKLVLVVAIQRMVAVVVAAAEADISVADTMKFL